MCGDWTLNQQNRIAFVLVDNAGTEVTGLGNAFTLQVSKAGGAFAGSAGTKAEISNGWYTYLSTAGEADTIGPLAVRAFGAGTVQQNLEYVVQSRISGAVEFTYTLTNSVTLLPIDAADVWVSTDIAGSNVIWRGRTDVNGVARDVEDNLPWLDPGTYYFWSQKVGFTFTNPDTEVVS
jgi:hypothetical protein